MDKIFTAFQFLTILPLNIKRFKEELLAESTIYFPLVGLTLGGFMVALEYCLSGMLPREIISIIQVAFLALITGGLHLDGFADTIDGIGCAKSSEERMQAMKDSRIGSMGAVGLIFLLILKYNSLALINQSLKTYAALIFPMASRWAMVLAILLSSQKSHTGIGNMFQKQIKEKHFIMSSILPFIFMIYLFESLGLIGLIGLSFVVFALFKLLLKIFGKITGDHFGFINETTELIVLLLFLAI